MSLRPKRTTGGSVAACDYAAHVTMQYADTVVVNEFAAGKFLYGDYRCGDNCYIISVVIICFLCIPVVLGTW
ncbi:MAG TPA: hypothetical protein VEC36_05585 [Patescibacteria group bacterium]|nr:hypothetical protein [Patescibacteria group bacterium]